MKKKLAILLSSLMVVSLFAGCGKKEAASAGAASNSGKKITIKVGHSAAETNTMQWAWLQVKERVEKNSNGRMAMEIYPNSQLGNERELIEATQLGNVTMCATSSAPVAAFKKEFFAFDLPFVYTDK